MCDCLDRDDTMFARALALVPASDERIEAHRVVGRFHESPAQIAVAALAIAVSLPLAVGQSPKQGSGSTFKKKCTLTPVF